MVSTPRVGVGEVDGEHGGDVAAAPWPRPAPTGRAAAATEHVAEDVAEATGATHVADVEPEAPSRATASTHAGHRAQPTNLVVLGALRVVAEHVVRRRHLLEALLRGGVAGVLVGVELARELPVRLGDVLRRGVVSDAEDLVVVLLVPFALRGHRAPRSPPQSFVLTMAARRTRPFHR